MDRPRTNRENSKVPPAFFELLLIAALTFAAVGAMVASFGIAKAFMGVVHASQSVSDALTAGKQATASAAKALASMPTQADCNWPRFAGLAALFTLLAAGVALVSLRALPDARRDCDRYGRHMIGLTYVLVVLGLCNAIGTSILALDGWLTVSVASLMESANPKRAREADEHKTDLENRLYEQKKSKRATERKLEQLADDARACEEAEAASPGAPATSPEAAAPAGVNRSACADERLRIRDQETLVIEHRDRIADLDAEIERASNHCKKAREDSRLALFFLLSLSTMMALLGACFYVVNSVRLKRLAPDEELSPDRDTREPVVANSPDGSSVTNEVTTDQEVVSTRVDVEVPSSSRASAPLTSRVKTNTTVTKPSEKGESFDEHAFWSGAFFRVGEAVLFTFAFFWLMWTSDESGNIAWLPVLGLFIGMFVKTGETIVFRLGMRALSAAEAMLPSPGSTSSASRTTVPNATPDDAAPRPSSEAPPQKNDKPPAT